MKSYVIRSLGVVAVLSCAVSAFAEPPKAPAAPVAAAHAIRVDANGKQTPITAPGGFAQPRSIRVDANGKETPITAPGGFAQPRAIRVDKNGNEVPITAPGKFQPRDAKGQMETGGVVGPLGSPTPDMKARGKGQMETGGVAGPVGSPTPDMKAPTFTAVQGPGGRAFVRESNGELWMPVTAKANLKSDQLPPVILAGDHTGVVKGPTGLSFYRAADGTLYRPVTAEAMKQEGMHATDLPPVIYRPKSE